MYHNIKAIENIFTYRQRSAGLYHEIVFVIALNINFHFKWSPANYTVYSLGAGWSIDTYVYDENIQFHQCCCC